MTYNRWSDKEDAMLKRFAGRLTPKEIADHFPLRTENAIRMRMHQKELSVTVGKTTSRKNKPLSMAEIKRVVAIYLDCERSWLDTCIMAKIEYNRLNGILKMAKIYEMVPPKEPKK